MRRAARKRWVVNLKAPFAGPEIFLKYISRYVHRVAIDDRRILAYDGQRVTFQYRDRRRGDSVREMTLSATAFLRRFLLHLLPKGFMKIRSYGLLANGKKKENLKRCRELLPPPPESSGAGGQPENAPDDAAEKQGRVCPTCEKPLVLKESFAAEPDVSARPP